MSMFPIGRDIALCAVAFFLFTLNLWPVKERVPVSSPMEADEFDPRLAIKLRSVDDVLQHADSIALAKGISDNGSAYWDELAQVLRLRFYHGYAYYALQDNWIAYLLGKLVWNHLHAIVLPDDVLKHPMAACSQQSIVLMECMKRKGIPYRAVKFAHHYAVEGKIGDRWQYFDPNMEPKIPAGQRMSYATYMERGQLMSMYAHKLEPVKASFILRFQSYGGKSAEPAPRAAALHVFTGVLSRIGWIIPLVILVLLNSKQVMPSDAKVLSNR